VSRTVELEAILDRLPCVDFVIENGDRPVRDVALDVLIHAQWVTAAAAAAVRLAHRRAQPDLSAAAGGAGAGPAGPSGCC
jgi:hypothetical protein